MKVIFGLGNPGKQYIGTRHNVGYDALDSYAIKQVSGFVLKDKFKAEIAEISLSGNKLLLVRPQTFYNAVGESLRAVMDFYKVTPEDCLVIHDELALPFGMVRVRSGGSDAGNNGIKSINLHGGDSTMRLRVGVASDKRALYGYSEFVLGRFSEEERSRLIQDIQPTLHSLIEEFTAGSIGITSHRHDVN